MAKLPDAHDQRQTAPRHLACCSHTRTACATTCTAGHRANRWSLSLERSVRTGVSGVHSGTVPRSVATW